MADPTTKFVTNDPLTRKKWAKDLFRMLLPAVEFNSFVGTGSDSVIQMNKDLCKGEGDEVTMGIRLPLTGEGIVGDDTVEGNEERLRFRNFKLTIEELNHAVDTGGKMDEQRIPINLFQEGKDALQEWWGDKLSNYIVNLMCSNSKYKIRGRDFAQPIAEPSANRYFRVNDVANDGLITSADGITLAFLDRLKQRAEVPTYGAKGLYKIRPIMRGGKKYYRVVMHSYTFDELKRNTNLGEWGDLVRQTAKLAGAGLEDADIIYNGLVISKSERVPLIVPSAAGDGSGCYRVALMGSQAFVFAWGGAGESKSTTMAFHPYTRDADRYVMIRGGGIFGARKVQFEGEDFGCVTGACWSAPATD